jgi:DNA-binding winged helix-turn-helix (wHTH) protein
LEADGLFVGKEDLLSRVWPGIVVSDRFREVIRNGSAAGHRGLGFPDR